MADTNVNAQDRSFLENAVVYKVGVNHALRDLVRVPICEGGKYGAPVRENGTVYVPLAMTASAFGGSVSVSGNEVCISMPGTADTRIALGTKNAVSGGKKLELTFPVYEHTYEENGKKLGVAVLISICDVNVVFPGLYVTYDDMGLIVICGRPNVYNRKENLYDMVKLMNSFIFDFPSGEKVVSDVEDHIGLNTHPKLMVDQARFDELREQYSKYLSHLADESVKCDETIGAWIHGSVSSVKKYINDRFEQDPGSGIWSWKKNEDGSSMAESVRNHNYLYDENGDPIVGKEGTDKNGKYVYGDGYDVGGRSNASSVTGKLDQIGFAWQVTTDPAEKEMYKQVFYLITVEAGKWPHWGPGHFLNCADATAPYALGLDWIYNAFDPVKEADKIAAMTDVLFRKGVYMGYVQFHNELPEFKEFHSARQGGGFNWKDKTNNWVTVCASGMLIGALAMLEYVNVKSDKYDYRKIQTSLIEDTIAVLPDSFGVYAPAGCYVESPGYWSYGTNTFFKMNEVLASAAGTTYGFMNCYGIDKTCNFATYIESSDYQYWNYHDAGAGGSIDSSYFTWYGQYMGQPDIASIRYMQIRNGKTSANLQDILFYDPSLCGKDIELSLDCYCEGIQTYVCRSSWEKGAMFVGIHGGKNTVPHGNLDAGNFIIYRGKDQFAIDLGADNYNVGHYYGNAHLYRLSAEGANTVAVIHSEELPFGQNRDGEAVVTDMKSCAGGTYAVLDMAEAYAPLAKSAKRGMMYTNGRRTVIIQDEIEFADRQDVCWFMHTDKELELSEDARTAYITVDKDGEKVVMRASIISEDKSQKFSITDTHSFFLSTTYTEEQVMAGNKFGQKEVSRDGIKRLVISADGVKRFNCTVEFEFVSDKSDRRYTEKVTPLTKWSI